MRLIFILNYLVQLKVTYEITIEITHTGVKFSFGQRKLHFHIIYGIKDDIFAVHIGMSELAQSRFIVNEKNKS